MSTSPTPTPMPVPKRRRPLKKPDDPRLPATVPGRPPRARQWTPVEARAQAELLFRTNRSNLRTTVLDLVYQFLALSQEQLFRLCQERVQMSEDFNTFTRNLSNYATDGVVGRLPDSALREAHRAGWHARLPAHGPQRVYRLEAVGMELAKLEFNTDLPLLHDGGLNHQVHDLLCAEAMLRMRETWAARRVRVEARGTQRVAMWQTKDEGKGGAFGLVPDGLLVKYQPDQTTVEKAYLVELDNEAWASSAPKKIKAYEAVGKPTEANQEIWRKAWGVPTMPYVLVIYRHAEALRNYQKVFAQTYADLEPHCNYLALALDDIWAGNALNVTPLRVKKKKPGGERALA